MSTAVFPDTLESYAAQDLRDQLGGVSYKGLEGAERTAAQVAYSQVNSAFSGLQGRFATYFNAADDEVRAAAETDILQQLENIPAGYQAIAVQYVRDSLEAGKPLNDHAYKNTAGNLYRGYNVNGEQLDNLYVSPAEQESTRAQREAERQVEQQAEQQRLTAERNILEPQNQAQHTRDYAFLVTPKENLLINEEYLQKLLDGHENRQDMVMDKLAQVTEKYDGVLNDRTLSDEEREAEAMRLAQEMMRLQTDPSRFEVKPAHPMVTENANPKRAIPEVLHDTLTAGRDPELAKDIFVDLLNDRAAQLEQLGMAIVSHNGESLSVLDQFGQELVLWEVIDETGGADYVLMTPQEVMKSWNEMYLGQIDAMGDALEAGQNPEQANALLSGIGDVARDTAHSLDVVRAREPDYSFKDGRPDIAAMPEALQAAIHRRSSNELGAEMLETQLKEAEAGSEQSPVFPTGP